MKSQGNNEKGDAAVGGTSSSGKPFTSPRRGIYEDFSFRFASTYVAVPPTQNAGNTGGHQGTNLDESTTSMASSNLQSSRGGHALAGAGGGAATPRHTQQQQHQTPHGNGYYGTASHKATASAPTAAPVSFDGALSTSTLSHDEQPLGDADAGRNFKRRQRLTADKMLGISLMGIAQAQNPNTAPLFAGSTENSGGLKAVSQSTYHPITRRLLPPSLGLAAGTELIGTQSNVFAMTVEERSARLRREKGENTLLFDWWDKRESVRMHFRERAAIEKAISGQLLDAVRDLVVGEEGYWIDELCHSQIKGSDVCVNPKLKPYTSGPSSSSFGGGNMRRNRGTDMMSQSNGISAVGATTRGVIIPIKNMEILFRALRLLMHERAGALLRSYKESVSTIANSQAEVAALKQRNSVGNREASGKSFHAPPGSPLGLIPSPGSSSAEDMQAEQARKQRECSEELLNSLINTQQELATEIRTVSRHNGNNLTTDGAALVPSCIALPPERALSPVISIETATSVALMWKILEQVRTVVPGVDFALQLLSHYIIPHVYEHYAGFESTLPNMGGLSEQIAQLSAVPLRVNTSRWAHEAVMQCKEDTRYMEYAMKRWALRTWRSSVVLHRRLLVKANAVGNSMARLRRRLMLRSVFDAWRFEARESSNHTYMSLIEGDYRAFINGSSVTRQVEDFMAPTQTMTIPNFDRTKFIATKLAETARHIKPRAPAQNKHRSSPIPSKPTTTFVSKGGIPLPSVQKPSNQQQNSTPRSSGEHAGSENDRHNSERTTAHPSLVEVDAATLQPSARHVSHGGELQNSELPLELVSVSVYSPGDTVRVQDQNDFELPALFAPGHSPPAQQQPITDICGADEIAALRASVDSLCSRPSSERRQTSHSGIPSSAGTTSQLRLTRPGGRPRTFLRGEEQNRVGGGNGILRAKAVGTFEDMLARLRGADEVCTHLRSELAIQSKLMSAMELEKRQLQERNRQLEADLLRTVSEKLHCLNVVQEKQFQLAEKDRRITQLKSRLRAHRNRPWQKTVLRVVGEMCGVSTEAAEEADEQRIHKDLKSDSGERAAAKKDGDRAQRGGSINKEEDDGLDDEDHVVTALFAAQQAREAEEERLFGQLAPIVLSSTNSLPDALVLLQDWGNSCLNDLQSLDDLKGGALSLRLGTFSEEVRNGVLLSRLLFYLALPRYLQRTAVSDEGHAVSSYVKLKVGIEDAGNNSSTNANHTATSFDKAVNMAGEPLASDTAIGINANDFPDRRRQLLEKRNVQLDAPYPTYAECFGDLLNMRPSERMTLLLQFATELVTGADYVTSDALEMRRQAVHEAVFDTLDLEAPTPAGRIELQEIIDPHSLAMGERASVVTLMALLYTRFAHPFNHKSRQSAEVERAAVIYLLSGGQSFRLQQQQQQQQSGFSKLAIPDSAVSNEDNKSKGFSVGEASTQDGSKRLLTTMEEEFMAKLEDDDKSPWQLFKERCLPVFGTAAHPFLLRGNFWPSDAFDSPFLADVLGELGMALNRSLQLHRWHVTLSCLVPVLTYSGLSRGVFTGPRASPTALRVGLEREGNWEFPLHAACITALLKLRAEAMRYAVRKGYLAQQDVLIVPSQLPTDTGIQVSEGLPVAAAASAALATGGVIGGPNSSHLTTSKRGSLAIAGVDESAPVNSLFSDDSLMSRESSALLSALGAVSSDLLSLFLNRSVLSAELALPTLDLGGWRLLCADLRLITLTLEEEKSMPLDMEVVTEIFFAAVSALTYYDQGSFVGSVLGSNTASNVYGTAAVATGAMGRPGVGAGAGHTRMSMGGITDAMSGSLRTTKGDELSGGPNAVAMPTMGTAMTYPVFAVAMVLVADAMYPPPKRRGRNHRSTGSARPNGSLTLPGSTTSSTRGFTDDHCSSNATGAAVASPLGQALPHARDSAGELFHKTKDRKGSNTGNPDALWNPNSSGARARDAAAANNNNNNEAGERRGSDGDRTSESSARGVDPSEEFGDTFIEGGGDNSTSAPIDEGLVRGGRNVHSNSNEKIVWLADALKRLVYEYVVPSPASTINDKPRSVIKRLTMGVGTQEVLGWFGPSIVVVYNAYSKDVYGAAGMEKEDLLRLLRDAMLTSTEISQFLVYELFQHCCITRKAIEEFAGAKRRELDGKPRDSQKSRKPAPRAVSIMDPRTNVVSSGKRKDIQVLTFEGFVEFLCVLCHFKQPNPLIPFEQRLGSFLRRSVLRPLSHKVENLSAVLSRAKLAKEIQDEETEGIQKTR